MAANLAEEVLAVAGVVGAAAALVVAEDLVAEASVDFAVAAVSAAEDLVAVARFPLEKGESVLAENARGMSLCGLDGNRQINSVEVSCEKN